LAGGYQVKINRERFFLEIARRSPPKNHHDVFMIEVYQRLLEIEDKRKGKKE